MTGFTVKSGFYKDGKKRALTMSYDDGAPEDRILVGIFNDYGIRGTFHLNSARVMAGNSITAEEVGELYRGHEVAVHCVNHPFLEQLPKESVVYEIFEDRRNLESLVKYPVRGMSYPFGTYSNDVISTAKSLGICYSRTVRSTNGFGVPNDFMQWNPTCHHNGGIIEKLDQFANYRFNGALFYVWGHGFEFTRNNNFDMMKSFCEKASALDGVWFATNIELYDYITAVRSIVLTADRDIAYNPTATDVWLDVNGEAVMIPAGKSVSFR